MGVLTKFNPLRKVHDFDLQGGLDKLCDYGKPYLHCFARDRWHCKLSMFINGVGVEVDIYSEFNEKTPLDAVTVCYERTLKAVEKMGGNK